MVRCALLNSPLHVFRVTPSGATADVANAAGDEGDEGNDESAAAQQAVLNGAVAAVVYRSAIKAIPGSVEFRAKFLEILAPFDFPGRAALEVGCSAPRSAAQQACSAQHALGEGQRA